MTSVRQSLVLRATIGIVATGFLLLIAPVAMCAQAAKPAGTKPAASAAGPTVTGELGSPSATTTISGKQLPPPDPKFGGTIKGDALQSKPWWAPRVVPPKRAPNILLIMTDDAGFGVPSTFGGVIPTPTFAASQVGPFDQWPTGMGFEYFYGFVGGDANQWQPNLFRNTTQIFPFEGKPEWNLVTGMADDAIEYLNRIHQIQPDKPFFLHYVPGATHAPHHPTKEWVDKIHAMHLFDDGWNKLRERIFENQKRLGVIPADTQLEPWPTKHLKNWDDCTPEEKKLFIRQVEVFAAYAAYNDHEIGRVVQAVEDMGKLDDTLVIYINGDNGTSAEGGPLGTPNEVAFFNGVNMMPAAEQMKWYDVWGSEQTYNHMSAGWAWERWPSTT